MTDPSQRIRNFVLAHKVASVSAAAGLAILVAVLEFRSSDKAEYLTARVTRGDIHDVVEATGTVNAVTTVQVGSQVSGTIAKLFADFNSRVHRGQVIALIDPALFQGALGEATADLENSKANLTASRANLAKARATEVQTKADFDRAAVLVKQKAESQQYFDLAKANYLVAESASAQAIAGVTQAEAQVRQKEAAVAVAQSNLNYTNYTTIRSPIDGIVVARNVDVGQTVAASLQAPTIFTIAQDLTKMQVYAKTDESDVGRIQVGQQVTFKVDAFPKDEFRGIVSQKRMNATTVQNVVTYDTIINFANSGMKLFPGMTAFLTIPVASVDNVLEVPNTALRFHPLLEPAKLRALYVKYGIDPAPRGETRATETAVVWKLRNGGKLEPVEIATGITDHAYTQVLRFVAGELQAGDDIVTASVASKPTRL